MKKTFQIVIAVIFAILILIVVQFTMFKLPSHSKKIEAKNLMNEVKADKSSSQAKVSDTFGDKNLTFATNLLKYSYTPGENTLISPPSVLMALAMTENGADTTTLAEMQKVLCGYDVAELNENLQAYTNSLKEDKETKIANSIWFRNNTNRFKISKDFLQTNANDYRADVFSAAFDTSTTRDINQWISNHTDHMVTKALDKIPSDAMMYLVNTVLFEAKWQNEYTSDMVSKGDFTDSKGNTKTVDFLHGKEGVYLENENVTGFMKDYAGGRYSFVALLPKGDLQAYLNQISGEEITNLINQKQEISVSTSIPKFKYQYKTQLSEPLKKMGILEAFTDKADFSKMVETPSAKLCIGSVIHNTAITLNEIGTKAGAVTIVEMRETATLMKGKEVNLDKPFVYMIYDKKMGVPVFMGVLNQVK